NDVVDFNRAIFLRHVVVTNQADHAREVRLFFHYDWHIWNDAGGNTVFYYPPVRALDAYKQMAYFLMDGQIGSGDQAQIGISSWATGIKEFNGAEGTWRAIQPRRVRSRLSSRCWRRPRRRRWHRESCPGRRRNWSNPGRRRRPRS